MRLHGSMVAAVGMLLGMAFVGLPARPALSQTVRPAAIELDAYFKGGRLRRAGQQLLAGNASQAIRTVEDALEKDPRMPERPQARYLLGLAYIQVGRYPDAARLFDELSLSYPLLRDDHVFHRGRALYLWGSYLKAAEVFASVDPDGPHGDEARRLRAWAMLKATDFERLVRWLEGERVQDGEAYELRYIEALARHRTGDVVGAYRGLREVWRRANPDLAGPALVQLAKLKIGSRSMISESERRLVLSMEQSLSGRDPLTAFAKLGRRLRRTPGSERLRAELGFAAGRAAESRRRFRTASGHYQSALNLAPTGSVDLRAQISLSLGRVEEWNGRTRQALVIYEQLYKRFADRPEAEEALFRSAEIELRSRHYAEARKLCDSLLLRNPVTPFRRTCLWNVAWAQFRLGEYVRAQQFFEALRKTDLTADLEGASMYWLARTKQSLQNPGGAIELFETIIRKYPLSYYASLAEGQLVQPLDEGSLAGPVVERKKSSAANSDLPLELVQAAEYIRLGLKDRALQVVTSFREEAERSHRPLSEAAYRAMAHVLERLGKYLDARHVRMRGFREYRSSLGDAKFVAAAQRAHPLKFEEPIREAALRFEIPESLLFALVRTESGFNQFAVSNMRAYGLAQLIIPTARTVSRRIRAGRVTGRRLLTRPAFNVLLGAAYLRELLDLYDGSEPMALAAYNAGPRAVDAWTRRRLRRLEGVKGRGVGVRPDPDELAEEIPVEETRRFVKAVLARARGYARLYPNQVEVEGPADLGDLTAALPLSEPSDLPAPRTTGRLEKARTVRVFPWDVLSAR